MTLKMETRAGGHTVPDFGPYYEATVIQAVTPVPRQTNRPLDTVTVSSHTHTDTHFLTKVQRQFNGL